MTIEGVGPQIQDNGARGWTAFEYLPSDLQNAEDSTLENDHSQRHWRRSVVREREASATERALLEHLGYQLPAQLTTRVAWLSAGVRNRRWPQLEGQHP